MPDKDGGPAFGRPAFYGYDKTKARQVAIDGHDGMSLRDWFAGMAMAGFCSATSRGPAVTSMDCARHAYDFADAMISQRTKETT